MIDLNKKVQSRVMDSLSFVQGDTTIAPYAAESDKYLKSVEDRGVQAGILKNFKSRVMDSDEGRAFITSNNYGPFIPESLPIITAWYPEFPLKDLVSVQDMEQDLAYIITSELLVATNKSDSVQGEKVETPAGPRTIHGKYPTGEVFGEVIEQADIVDAAGVSATTALAYFPILTDEDSQAQLKITTVGTSVAASDWAVSTIDNGIITFTSATVATHTITLEVATGILTLLGGTAENVTQFTVSYVWNLEFATDENIPSVVEDMKMVPMIAKPRALAMKWSIFSEYVKKKQFGTDIRTNTTKRVLDLLYQYQVRYTLDKLYNGATGTPVTITIPTTTLDLNLKVQQVLALLNQVSNQIQANTGRIEGNRLVIGLNFKGFLESLPDTYFKKVADRDYGFNGPREIGTFGRFRVYFDDKLGNDKAFMTYRGNEWYDAAMYIGVFMPMAPTEAIAININVRQAFVDMLAYRLDKPLAVIPITFN